MIVVVGAGALGGLVGGLLALAGEDVLLVLRDPARAAALDAGGLWLEGPPPPPGAPLPAPRRAPVRATTAPADRVAGRPISLVVLAVKVPDTPSALAHLAALDAACAPAPSGPPVLVLQNGLGGPDAVARALGAPERVVVGVTTEGATLLSPDRVRWAGRGRTTLGPHALRAPPAPAAVAAAVLARAGLAVERVDDVRPAVWRKLVVNAGINGLTGLLDCPNGALLADPSAAGLADDAAAEAAAVAATLGLPGDWSPAAAAAAWRAVAAATAANVSSLLADLRRGRPTEADAIHGAVVREARALGLAAPVNDALTRLVAARTGLAGGGAARDGAASPGPSRPDAARLPDGPVG